MARYSGPLHGLFESTAACGALLGWAGLNSPEAPDYAAIREAAFERLADLVEQHLDTEQLLKLINTTRRQ